MNYSIENRDSSAPGWILPTVDNVTDEIIQNMDLTTFFYLSDSKRTEDPDFQRKLGKVCYMAFVNLKPVSRCAFDLLEGTLKKLLNDNWEKHVYGDYIIPTRQLSPDEQELSKKQRDQDRLNFISWQLEKLSRV